MVGNFHVSHLKLTPDENHPEAESSNVIFNVKCDQILDKLDLQ